MTGSRTEDTVTTKIIVSSRDTDQPVWEAMVNCYNSWNTRVSNGKISENQLYNEWVSFCKQEGFRICTDAESPTDWKWEFESEKQFTLFLLKWL